MCSKPFHYIPRNQSGCHTWLSRTRSSKNMRVSLDEIKKEKVEKVKSDYYCPGVVLLVGYSIRQEPSERRIYRKFSHEKSCLRFRVITEEELSLWMLHEKAVRWVEMRDTGCWGFGRAAEDPRWLKLDSTLARQTYVNTLRRCYTFPCARHIRLRHSMQKLAALSIRVLSNAELSQDVNRSEPASSTPFITLVADQTTCR